MAGAVSGADDLCVIDAIDDYSVDDSAHDVSVDMSTVDQSLDTPLVSPAKLSMPYPTLSGSMGTCFVFYVVRKGHKPGIYSSWLECKLHTDDFIGA